MNKGSSLVLSANTSRSLLCCSATPHLSNTSNTIIIGVSVWSLSMSDKGLVKSFRNWKRRGEWIMLGLTLIVSEILVPIQVSDNPNWYATVLMSVAGSHLCTESWSKKIKVPSCPWFLKTLVMVVARVLFPDPANPYSQTTFYLPIIFMAQSSISQMI